MKRPRVRFSPGALSHRVYEIKVGATRITRFQQVPPRFGSLGQFGAEGIIQENDPDEQQKRIRCLGLLASGLIYWNVLEIRRAIGELASQGYPLNKADVAHLRSYPTRLIKRFRD